MTDRYIVAIDLGTSGPKVAVVSPGGDPVGTARAHVDTIHLPDGGIEQDPDQVWRSVVEATRAALAASAVERGEVAAVICTSQYSSIVPVDHRGRPTANMILWQDHRGATPKLKHLPGVSRRLDNPVSLGQWLRLHGLPPIAGGISMTHMRYLKFGRPEVYERTAHLLEPMDFLTMRLTGRATANQATAFMSLMVDNRTLDADDYSDTLVKQSLIDREKLPELVPMDEVVGNLLPEVADELGLSPDTRVVTGLNDTQAGGIGCGAFTGSHAGVSVGSTCVMITHVDRKHTDVRHAILSMPSPVPGRYFVMAENGMAGAALDRFLTNVVYPTDPFHDTSPQPPGDRFDRLDSAAAAAPAGSNNLLVLPWIGGSIAPAANDLVRGGFLNMTATTTRSDMARAVLEGVALNLRWLRGPVEKFAKRSFDRFTFFGGGAQSDLWCQIMADVMGTPVHQLEHGNHTVSIGAALLAFERLGVIGFDEIAAAVRTRRVFEPDPEHSDTYDLLAAQLTRAFARNKSIFRALNRG